jgi:hypothetical protein
LPASADAAGASNAKIPARSWSTAAAAFCTTIGTGRSA